MIGVILLVVALVAVVWMMNYSVSHDHYTSLSCQDATCLEPCKRCLRNCKSSYLGESGDCYQACGRYCLRQEDEVYYNPPAGPAPQNPGW